MFTGLQIPWKMVNYQFVPICKCYLFSEWALHFVVDVNFSRACIITSPKNVAQRENNQAADGSQREEQGKWYYSNLLQYFEKGSFTLFFPGDGHILATFTCFASSYGGPNQRRKFNYDFEDLTATASSDVALG